VLEQGDPELRPEFIDLVELGLVKDFKDNSMYATAYYRNIDNLVNRVNTIFNDTIINRIFSNVGAGRSIGFEGGMELVPSDKFKVFAGGNLYNYDIEGSFANRPVSTNSWIFSFNANATYNFTNTLSVQGSFNYISSQNTALGENSRFYTPNLTLRKTFLNGRLTTTVQWLNIDLGLLKSAEKSIIASREATATAGAFSTFVNYVNEVDMIMINVSYSLNDLSNKSRFIKSEFGEKEF
jgi:outer membrane receptor protein involved in Fe transport